ncbi:hypothetical protein [Arcobacter sp. LA11]|uniref:hypothetical protein n=1 Tax=Arcobacter sp. LA11 TaxID=1898176 RepID=UPI000932EE72|nr:hypothetical protein [Arcobacter sp. LA11]
MDIESMNINKKVLVLAIYKKEEDETLTDVIKKMDNTKVFTLKEGKKYLKELRKEQLVLDDYLTMMGIVKAKEIELEFKI